MHDGLHRELWDRAGTSEWLRILHDISSEWFWSRSIETIEVDEKTKVQYGVSRGPTHYDLVHRILSESHDIGSHHALGRWPTDDEKLLSMILALAGALSLTSHIFGHDFEGLKPLKDLHTALTDICDNGVLASSFSTSAHPKLSREKQKLQINCGRAFCLYRRAGLGPGAAYKRMGDRVSLVAERLGVRIESRTIQYWVSKYNRCWASSDRAFFIFNVDSRIAEETHFRKPKGVGASRKAEFDLIEMEVCEEIAESILDKMVLDAVGLIHDPSL